MLGAVLRRLLRGTSSPEAPQLPPSTTVQITALHRSGRYTEAAALCRKRLTHTPDDVEALQLLAASLLATGATAEGADCLRRACVAAPGDPAVRATLAQVCLNTGDLDGAIDGFESALALDAGREDWRDQLARLLKALARYDEAEDVCRAHPQLNDAPALKRLLTEILFEQGRVQESLGLLRELLTHNPDDAALHSDLLRALNYLDEPAPEAIYDAHVGWDARHAAPLFGSLPPPCEATDPERRLRIGYVSPYFRKHAVTFFLESVIEQHDRERFEIVLYADVPQPDEYSKRLQAYGARWSNTVGLSDEALAQRIREDGTDILVDLSGHTPGNRLLTFARRPAPVQVTWNGYPNTTGMGAMDYRITDGRCDPPGRSESLHRETLVRLPDVFMSWRPPIDAPEPEEPPALRNGYVTFGSFNSVFKLTPTTIRLWSEILKCVGRSRLLLLTVSGQRARRLLLDAFEQHGIGTDRLHVVSRVSHELFLQQHREVDIALDAFPFHGTTTTCFSLWMGVPVVSLVGATHVSRVGLSLLSSVGLERLAARGEEDYIRRAVELAGDLPALTVLRAGLRERVRQSALTDGVRCARALENAYRSMWRTWCRRSQPSASQPPD